jgi:hypothetical protein
MGQLDSLRELCNKKKKKKTLVIVSDEWSDEFEYQSMHEKV